MLRGAFLLWTVLVSLSGVLAEEIVDGLVKLDGTGTFSSARGLLFVNVAGVWGTICEHNFTDIDAGVACVDLGFPKGMNHKALYVSKHEVNRTDGTTNILMDQCQCLGNEQFLTDCKYNPNTTTCTHDNDVGVFCEGPDLLLANIDFGQAAPLLFSPELKSYNTITNSSHLILTIQPSPLALQADINVTVTHAEANLLGVLVPLTVHSTAKSLQEIALNLVNPSPRSDLLVSNVTIVLSALFGGHEYTNTYRVEVTGFGRTPPPQPPNANPCNCTHGFCNPDTLKCTCESGYEGTFCSKLVKDPNSYGWGMVFLFVIGLVCGVICLERLFTSCKKVYLRKTGRTGFVQLPVINGHQGESLGDFDDEDVVMMSANSYDIRDSDGL